MSTVSSAGKKIGRPEVNATPVNVRVPPTFLESLDGYIAATDPTMSRPEAIRRIVEFALATRRASMQTSPLDGDSSKQV